MLAGEAGIGKTWIARALAQQTHQRGAIILWSCCFEGDWQPAYGPWVEAIGEYARTVDPERLREALGSGAASIVKLFPQLRALLPDGVPDAAPLVPDEERIRLYDALIRFLLAVAEEHPILLVIDDLHWADIDSLRLLRYVSRFLSRSRILVVGAYREPDLELANRHPLADLLPVMRREIDYLHLGVHGLSREDVAEYLSQASGQPMPGGLVQAIYEETGGNPFYVRELFRHLAEEQKILVRGGRWSTDLSIGELGIPEGVRHVVNRRMSRLSAETNAILRLVTGFTSGFEFSVLQALSGLPEEALLDCLDEALAAGILHVTEGSPPTYDFAHSIVRHTLYDELNPDRRARLHRRIALALEEVHGVREAERAAELAAQYHASASMPGAEKGLPYAISAAEQARAAYAHNSAATFYRMARDLATGSTTAERADILCKLAIAEAEALMLEDAQRSVEDALLSLSQAGAGPRERARYLAVVARALKDGGARPTAWNPLVEQGLALLGEQRDLLWAQLMLLRDRFEPVSIGAINAVRWLGHEPLAVTISRENGDEDDYARTLEPLDWRSREETESLLAKVRTWRRPAAIIRALDVVGRDLLKRHGNLRQAADLYREMQETSERFGSIPGQAEALMQLVFTHAALGELSQAQQYARRAQEAILRLGPAHELRFGAMAVTSLLNYFLDGDWLASATAVARFAASPEAARNPRGLVAGAYAALGYARAGDAAEASRLLTALTPVLARMEPIMYVHHAAIAFGGSAVWEIGAVEYAGAYRQLALDLIDAGFGDSILSPELTVARMAALLGKVGEAHGYFSRARQQSEMSGVKPVIAIADYDEALALSRSGSTDQGRILALLQAGQTAFRSMGMAGWVQRASSLQERVCASREVPAQPVSPYLNGLTSREIEVLRLLAAGRTNNDIAETLVLSVRTVERHIANIYGKIDAHGRADATAFAFNSGIAAGQSRNPYAVPPI
jgi:DNA-binding CsgD family transcriptional regulator